MDKWHKRTPPWYQYSTGGFMVDGERYRQKYMGIYCMKNPCDAWSYQEIIHETAPEVIVETGTYAGGSAVMLRDLQRAVEIPTALVITIDTDEHFEIPEGDVLPGIHKITGMSTDTKVVDRVIDLIAERSTMVILDSDHSEENVYQELITYAPLVTPGMYLIVEDGDAVPGPYEAANRWYAESLEQFTRVPIDARWGLSSNPGGYFRKDEE